MSRLAPRPLVPEGFRLVLDPRTWRTDGGATLVGGTPVSVLRLSEAGTRAVDALVRGAGVPAAGAANRLARRLLDLGLAHPRPPPGGDAAPEVTVVIPVRDDPAGLAATLAHLGPVEQVIVVDDGSADTTEVARAVDASPQAGRTRILRLDSARGPAGARQLGWMAATRPVVAFVDAGCEPGPGWLGALVAHLGDPAVAAVAPRVRVQPAPGTPSWLTAYERYRSPLDLGPVPAAVRPGSPVPFVPTAALVVRRSALEAVGGFDPAVRFGEDVDLVWRLGAAGGVIRYEPTTAATHPARPSLGALLRQRIDYGSSAAPLAARHDGAVAPLVISPWSAVAWGLGVLGHPWLAAAAGGASTAQLARRLSGVERPWAEASRLAGGGQLRAGGLLAEACRRSWWPLVTLACPCSRRVRRAAFLAAVVPPLLEPRPPSEVLALPGWLALRLLDDLAYGAGVWAGAARAGSAAALRPRLTSWSPGAPRPWPPRSRAAVVGRPGRVARLPLGRRAWRPPPGQATRA